MDMNMKLNYDIMNMLLVAVKHKATLISLMRTCHTLYTNGIPALLRLPGLCEFSYQNDARLASFCKFMLVDNRCRYLISLGIGTKVVIGNDHPRASAKDTVNLLVKVLEKAMNLKDISIFPNESLCATHPILTTTISSLTSIRDLKLGQWEGDGTRTAEMIEQIRSPIKIMHLNFGFPDLPEGNDPVSIISGLSSTLEQLKISIYQLRNTPTVFPRLHTLSVKTYMFVDIRPFISCFPNLHSLTFLLDDDEYHVGESDIEQTRQSNTDRQRSLSWPSLQSLEGTPLSLYLLAVCCPVCHLQITDTPEEDMVMLLNVLVETLPSRLTVTLLADDLEWKILPSLLSPSKKLTHLCVLLFLSHSAPTVAVVLDELSNFIRDSSVTFLKIHLQYIGYLHDLSERDAKAFAQQVFAMIPTLRHVCLGIGAYFMPSWVYRRNSDSPDPHLLSKRDGELVMEAEQM